MNNVPCIICQKEFKNKNKKVIAIVCEACNNEDNLDKILKNLTYSQVKKSIDLANKTKIRLTDDGEII